MMECAVVCVGCKGRSVMMECAVVLLVLVVGCIARWWGQMLVRVGVLVVWCRVMGCGVGDGVSVDMVCSG